MDRIIPQREWEAQERYLRFRSHADKAGADGDHARWKRWEKRADAALCEYQTLVKERESQ